MSKKVVNVLAKVFQALQEGKKSYREIAEENGVSKGTVFNIRKRLESSHIGVAEMDKLERSELLKVIYPKPGNKVEPDWEEVDEGLKNKNLTLYFFYERYLEKVEEDSKGYSYSNFCRRYRLWKKQDGAAMSSRHESQAGEKLEIDYSGDRLPWFDSEGERHVAHLFVAALPYSNLVFAMATDNEKRRSWIAGINAALRHIGGVPKLLVFDNSKALVIKPRRKLASGLEDAKVVPEIELLTEHYGMRPYACDIHTPKEKSRVEAAVNLVQRAVIGRLTWEEKPVVVKDLSDLNRKVLNCINQINDRPMSGKRHNKSRRQIFKEEEKKFLRALPPTDFYSYQWSVLKVDKSGCVKLHDAHRYSVPKSYIGQRVVVGAGHDEVLIFKEDGDHGVICKHERQSALQGVKTHVLMEHLSAKEKMSRRSAEQYVEEFVALGLDRRLCTLYVESCWDISAYWARKTLNLITRLFKDYEIGLINRAISFCLNHSGYSYTKMKQTLEYVQEEQRRQLPLSMDIDKNYKTVTHENIRNDYK